MTVQEQIGSKNFKKVIKSTLPYGGEQPPTYDEALILPVSALDGSVRVDRCIDNDCVKSQGKNENDGDNGSYSLNDSMFESYEDDAEDGGTIKWSTELEHSPEETTRANSAFEESKSNDCLSRNSLDSQGDSKEEVACRDSEVGEGKENDVEEDKRDYFSGSHSQMNRDMFTDQYGMGYDQEYCYDKNTYAIISRLRTLNMRLTKQLEQQRKLVEHLSAERKQDFQLITALRADAQILKQTIKALQANGSRRSNPREEVSRNQMRAVSPSLPLVGSCVNESGEQNERPTTTGGIMKVCSPKMPPSPASRCSRRLTSFVGSPRNVNAPHYQQPLMSSSTWCINNDQQLLDKYIAKLEKTEQEKKELQNRHAHQLANYSHELSRLERQLEHVHRVARERENELRLQKTRQLYHLSLATNGASVSGYHRTGNLLSDEFWKDLYPAKPQTDCDEEGNGVESTTGSSLTSHVGQAFQQLLGHRLVSFHDQTLDASTRNWLHEVRTCGAQMLQLHRSFQKLVWTLRRLAESCHLYELTDVLTAECAELVGAEQAIVFVADTAEQEFWCRVPRAQDGKDKSMTTLRSTLMPFASSASSGHDSIFMGTGTPCGLASMVYHTKTPLLLHAGQATKHTCFSTSTDNTDRLILHPSASTLLVPIVYNGHTLAVVQVCGKTTKVEALGLSLALENCEAFSKEDQSLLTLVCHFVSGLFPKVSYFTEVESNKVNEETLIQLAPEIFTCLRFEELGKVVIQNAKEILDADRCSLFVADNVARTLHNWHSDISGAGVEVFEDLTKSGMTIPFGHGIVGLVAETWQAINIVDAYEDPRFNSSWDKKTNYRTKSMLTVPILTNAVKKPPVRITSENVYRTNSSDASRSQQNPVQQEHQQTEQTLLGVVQVINKSGGAPFRSKDEFLLKTITKLIALAIENSQLFQKNQQLCTNVGKLIAQGDLVDAIISLGGSAEAIIGVEAAAIYVYDAQTLEMITFHHKRRHRIVLNDQMYRGSLLEEAMKTKKLLIVNDASAVANYNAYVDSIGGIVARNMLFAPLLVEDQETILDIGETDGPPTKLIGMVHLVNTKGRKLRFDRHDLFLSIVQSQCCSVVASIIEKQTMLHQKDQTNVLLDTSMSFFKEMSPIGVINAVYNACTSIFNAEKAHLFLWEPDRRHMWTSKICPHAESGGKSMSASRLSVSGSPSTRSGNSNSTSAEMNFIPSRGAQSRRISVLMDQKLVVPTTEGLLEHVLTKGTVVIAKQWLEDSSSETDRDQSRMYSKYGSTKFFLRASPSDIKMGFTNHSVISCPVWDIYGLEVVGVLVLLFAKGCAPQQSELTNLPILSRQISGALNVCSDLSRVTTRSRQLQGMLEMSKKKPIHGLSMTFSARGHLMTFSQPLNIGTNALNIPSLSACVHATTGLNLHVSSLPMDDEGHRWGFQLTAAPLYEMTSEHYVKWIGKDVIDAPTTAFDRLRTDMQSVYIRKEVVTGIVDCRPQAVAEVAKSGVSRQLAGLPKTIALEIRKLLWEFVDGNTWKVDVKRACQIFDTIESGQQRLLTRMQFEKQLTARGRRVTLDQMEWDLLHAQFADPQTDLVNVNMLFHALAPQIKVVQQFAYEITPVLDTVTQTVVSIHVLLTAATD